MLKNYRHKNTKPSIEGLIVLSFSRFRISLGCTLGSKVFAIVSLRLYSGFALMTLTFDFIRFAHEVAPARHTK